MRSGGRSSRTDDRSIDRADNQIRERSGDRNDGRDTAPGKGEKAVREGIAEKVDLTVVVDKSANAAASATRERKDQIERPTESKVAVTDRATGRAESVQQPGVERAGSADRKSDVTNSSQPQQVSQQKQGDRTESRQDVKSMESPKDGIRTDPRAQQTERAESVGDSIKGRAEKAQDSRTDSPVKEERRGGEARGQRSNTGELSLARVCSSAKRRRAGSGRQSEDS